jgi:hypothetical protein
MDPAEILASGWTFFLQAVPVRVLVVPVERVEGNLLKRHQVIGILSSPKRNIHGGSSSS